jgi:asparagine synthase (glutamine-hydrolysing)
MIVALMQKVTNQTTKTFCIGFQEPEYNEAPWAARVAKYLETDHTELYVSPKEAMEVVPILCEIYDEPFADSSAIPTYLASRLARSRVTVALSGDGADEQFAGYVRYWSTHSMAASFNKIPAWVRKLTALSVRRLPLTWVEKIYLPCREWMPQQFRVANFRDKWQKLVQMMEETRLQELYRMTICLWSESEIETLIGQSLPSGRYEEAFSSSHFMSPLTRLMYVDQLTYLPDGMLTKVDRASMAHGLEVRVPFLDNRIVEYTATLPEKLKYKQGIGKIVLRKLLSRYIPQELFNRPKMGFGIPLDHWFRKELKELLLDYLSVDRLKKEGLFDVFTVQQKIGEHLNGTANHQYRLWTLLIWQMWRERWRVS